MRALAHAGEIWPGGPQARLSIGPDDNAAVGRAHLNYSKDFLIHFK
jgi:hypothetical protein